MGYIEDRANQEKIMDDVQKRLAFEKDYNSNPEKFYDKSIGEMESLSGMESDFIYNPKSASNIKRYDGIVGPILKDIDRENVTNRIKANRSVNLGSNFKQASQNFSKITEAANFESNIKFQNEQAYLNRSGLTEELEAVDLLPKKQNQGINSIKANYAGVYKQLISNEELVANPNLNPLSRLHTGQQKVKQEAIERNIRNDYEELYKKYKNGDFDDSIVKTENAVQQLDAEPKRTVLKKSTGETQSSEDLSRKVANGASVEDDIVQDLKVKSERQNVTLSESLGASTTGGYQESEPNETPNKETNNTETLEKNGAVTTRAERNRKILKNKNIRTEDLTDGQVQQRIDMLAIERKKGLSNVGGHKFSGHSKLGLAVGSLVAAGSLVTALSNSRGQQSNAQLYGQQPLQY